jgi:sporulation protein YlmC with PRC-barrel domain
MLWKASTIHGYAIAASDGEIGKVSDFLFDDATWLIRWLVVETGGWLFGRKVLLPPSVLGHPDESGRQFSVRLTRQQVKESPPTDTDEPVSRQCETSIYDYYGWNPYWGSGFYMGGYGYMPAPISALSPGQSRKRADDFADSGKGSDDPHLRSVEAVSGYHVHARDGEIGHVEDFLVEDADWSIHYLIVDTKNWWPGRKVLISPRSAREIDWMDRLVHLDVDRKTVEGSPAYDAFTIVDQAYERDLHGHYAPERLTDGL